VNLLVSIKRRRRFGLRALTHVPCRTTSSFQKTGFANLPNEDTSISPSSVLIEDLERFDVVLDTPLEFFEEADIGK